MIKSFLFASALLFTSTFAVSANETEPRTLGEVFPGLETIYGTAAPFGADCVPEPIEPVFMVENGFVLLAQEPYPEGNMTLRLWFNEKRHQYLVVATSPALPGASCLMFVSKPLQES